MTAIPATMKALVSDADHTASVHTDVPVPKPSPDEILVRVEAWSLNPTDWKHIKAVAPPGQIIGCDFSGTVVAAAAAAGNQKSSVKVGDRVAGMVHGGKYTDRGSFAEYVKTDADLVVSLPPAVDSLTGATVGIAGYTAAQALFQRLALELPSASATSLPAVDGAKKVLVWAGSTAVGQWAIQLARAAGCYVVTTASPRNHGLVRDMGAAEVYDYADAATPQTIASKHPDLRLALDCISERGTQSLAVRSLGASIDSGKVVVLLKPEAEAQSLRPGVVAIEHTLIYTCLGHAFSYGKASFGEAQVQADKAFIERLTAGGLFAHLWATGQVRGNRLRREGSGLDALVPALALLEQGKVSGEKVVLSA